MNQSASPEMFTHDWVTSYIENWSRWLADFRGRPGVRCIEVGSYEGRSAVWLLQNVLTHPTSSIDCYDLFHIPEIVERFRRNTEPWKGQVRVHSGPSFSTLRDTQGEYDIAYIDGDHAPFAVMADAMLIWPALKVGGVMMFDDYLWLPDDLHPCKEGAFRAELMLEVIAENPMRATKTGIDGFLSAITGHYEVVEQSYQLAVRKTRETGLHPVPEARARWPAWLRTIIGLR